MIRSITIRNCLCGRRLLPVGSCKTLTKNIQRNYKQYNKCFEIGVNVIFQKIELINAEKNQVSLADGVVLSYDYLIIATGTRIVPEETEGLKAELWHKNIFDLVCANKFAFKRLNISTSNSLRSIP